MSTSTELLSRDGPLAYVWLAANLERKLTKQQLLNASISESTKAIAASSYVAPSSRVDLSQGVISQTNASQEVVSLRITGQLLYGVVKIYSRKTRYLYEDVSDALLKLKSAILRSESVILPVQSTVISSINNITLKDTITDVDLLYQEPFDFGDLENLTQNSQNDIAQRRSKRNSYPFGDSQLPNEDESSSTLFDDSIEIGRRAEEEDDLQGNDDDLDLNLNFDIEDDDGRHNINLSSDNEGSIEVGRAAVDDVNASALHSDPVDMDELLPDFQQPDLDFDMDDGMDFNQQDFGNAPPLDDVSFTLQTLPGSRRNKKRNIDNYRITNVVRTLRKRVVSDQVIELTYDIMQQNRLNYPVIKGPLTTENEKDLSVADRLKLVSRLANPSENISQRLIDARLNGAKRRRLDDTANNTREDVLRDLPDLVNHDDIFEREDSVTNAQVEPVDDVLDFQDFGGLDQPDYLEEEPQPEPGSEEDFQDPAEYDDSELIPDVNAEAEMYGAENYANTNVVSKSTIKIAGHLRELIPEEESQKPSVSFGDLMLQDLESEEPLSKSEKREATRAFFELLVIATGDAVALKQETLFGDIQITAKENLYSKFL